MNNPFTRLFCGLLLAIVSHVAVTADTQSAETAVVDVLFELDIENASYRVRHDGYVDILFGPALSDDSYQAAITALKAHPEIPGILAGRGASDFCPVP